MISLDLIHFVCMGILLGILRFATWLTIYVYEAFPFGYMFDYIYLHSRKFQSVFSYKLHDSEADAKNLALESSLSLQEHFVRTNDGYLLSIQRCKTLYEGKKPPSERQVVVLFHGLLQSSDFFLIGGENSLAFELCRNGYDVWLSNNRGNKYSHHHMKYSIDDAEYWDFDIDDYARYDVPAIIDFVTETTEIERISLIGFSQGTTQIFAALSLFPTLSSKIERFIAIAPAVYSKGIRPNLLSDVLTLNPFFVHLLFGKKMFCAMPLVWKRIFNRKLYAEVLSSVLLYFFGWKLENISFSRRISLFQNIFCPSSVKSVVHWFQILKNGEMCMYQKRTGFSLTSPKVLVYDLTIVSSPVFIIAGGLDDIVDYKTLEKKLPRWMTTFVEPKYEHLDLLWADDVNNKIFPKILEFLKKKIGK